MELESELIHTPSASDVKSDSPSFDELMEKIYKDVVYVVMPERSQKANAFIRKAIEISELYEMDVKIEKNLSHISATYYFNFGGSMKYLTEIIGMADDISFFGRKDKAYDIVMSLDFYTHATYRNGRQTNP